MMSGLSAYGHLSHYTVVKVHETKLLPGPPKLNNMVMREESRRSEYGLSSDRKPKSDLAGYPTGTP